MSQESAVIPWRTQLARHLAGNGGFKPAPGLPVPWLVCQIPGASRKASQTRLSFRSWMRLEQSPFPALVLASQVSCSRDCQTVIRIELPPVNKLKEKFSAGRAKPREASGP